MSKPHLAIVMMLKNEEKRLHVSLESVKNVASSIIILDTGSTDSTPKILADFSEKTKIPVRIRNTTFIDFATSRNELLDFADTFLDVDFLLLLDCNDELRGDTHLLKFLKKGIKDDITALNIAQEWWSGTYQRYVNIRFIRPRTGWRYEGVVHEFLKNTIKECYVNDQLPKECVLYQDRTLDDDKSFHRFSRDLVLLKKAFEENPTDERITYYLAQTYDCLNDHQNAYTYYKLRSTMTFFPEERYEAMYRCGRIMKSATEKRDQLEREIRDVNIKLEEIGYVRELAVAIGNDIQRLNHELGKIESYFNRPRISDKIDETFTELTNKFAELSAELNAHSQTWNGNVGWEIAIKHFLDATGIFPRIEGLIEMCKFFLGRREFITAYGFVKTASMMSVPPNSKLFVIREFYDYERWHLLGIVCFYVQQYQEGYDACLKAIEVKNSEIDKNNLKVYKQVISKEKKNGRKEKRKVGR